MNVQPVPIHELALNIRRYPNADAQFLIDVMKDFPTLSSRRYLEQFPIPKGIDIHP